MYEGKLGILSLPDDFIKPLQTGIALFMLEIHCLTFCLQTTSCQESNEGRSHDLCIEDALYMYTIRRVRP